MSSRTSVDKERPSGVREDMNSILDEDSDFSFVPPSWHVDSKLKIHYLFLFKKHFD